MVEIYLVVGLNYWSVKGTQMNRVSGTSYNVRYYGTSFPSFGNQGLESSEVQRA